MAKKAAKTRHQATVSRNSEKRHSGHVTKRNELVERLDIENVPDNPAFVTVGAAATKNMGDYNSVKCDVRLTMPCHPRLAGKGGIEETYAAASAWVDEKVQAELELAVGE